ncbi:hypothetical protein T10_2461 [Trichinella papuae]|uniref:Uncharacterized protein n=1 Tax=Trichinella papuae TaxID=268474 RepID=A0A0V1LZV2_9BILA|nr:hypothetical protein T10_2461 [Trichinella papuae]
MKILKLKSRNFEKKLIYVLQSNALFKIWEKLPVFDF